MESRVIGRGALAGLIAGMLAFVFAKIFAEPQINKAIAYESGRDAAIAKVDKLASIDGPEIFSRHIQSTVGIATGIIGFAIAMGALIAVVYLVLHGRFGIRPRTLALLIAGFGFLGIFMLPFVKYPANPPAIGHTFTITTRGHLYLALVVCSLLLLVGAICLGRRLRHRFGVYGATLIATGAFLVPFFVLIGVLPSLGNLAANVAQQHAIGYARASTETPQPITNFQGQIVYPGFPADVLWKFRWYAILNQMLIWGGTGLIFASLIERFVRPAPPAQSRKPAAEPLGASR
jgi:hypothetical protein